MRVISLRDKVIVVVAKSEGTFVCIDRMTWCGNPFSLMRDTPEDLACVVE